MLKICFYSLFPKVLNFYSIKFCNFLKKKLFFFSGPISTPKKIKKIILLSSPHVDKNAREQYEIRIKKVIFLVAVNKKKIEYILNFNLPSSIKVTFNDK
ncbi:30S ribosomal protein S10 [Candidatus Vidania fulgoroideorum]